MKVNKLILVTLILAAPMLAQAGFISPNLPAGSEYELIFVTRDSRDATSPYIADYNSFVTSQAGQDSSLPQSITWHAIASTAGDINTGLGQADANANAAIHAFDPRLQHSWATCRQWHGFPLVRWRAPQPHSLRPVRQPV